MIRRAAALAALCAMTAAAQDLRGVVRDGSTQQPVAGAVVRLIGPAGNEIARTLSNERGEYRLLLTGQAGVVRVVKIGYRPADHDAPALPSGTARLDVSIRPLATMLEAISVVDQPGCSKRADRAKALALWEQAKSGLLASVVARDVPAPDMRVLLYTRFLTPVGNRITEQWVQRHTGKAAAPFRAAKSAGDFVAQGFIQPGKTNNLYHAPDADVLLDENFPRGYCFGIAPRDRARPTQIGLTFSAAQRNRKITTVDGTLWIDTAARRLVDLRYRYQIDDAAIMRLEPGGQIEFREMENGVVLIERWLIRMVAMPTVDGAPARIMRETEIFDATSPSSVVLPRISEGGGELAQASWPGVPTWNGSLGTLRATVMNKAGEPLVGASMRLASTDYRGVTDSAGIVTMDELLPGPYSVEIEDSTLATIGVPLGTMSSFVAARDRQVDLLVTAQSASDFVGKMCQAEDVYDRKSFMLILRVVDKEGAPVSRASIELGGMPGNTASDGLYVWCKGLGLGDRVAVKAWVGEKITTESVLLSHRVTAVKIVVER